MAISNHNFDYYYNYTRLAKSPTAGLSKGAWLSFGSITVSSTVVANAIKHEDCFVIVF